MVTRRSRLWFALGACAAVAIVALGLALWRARDKTRALEHFRAELARRHAEPHSDAALRPEAIDAVWEAPTGAAPAQPLEYVWWEAERPRATDYPAKNPFSPSEPAGIAALSAGAWIGASGPHVRHFLEYSIEVPRTANYSFYARKFWRHGPFRFRFDDGPWAHVTSEVGLLDTVPIGGAVANWIFAGEVRLESGRHALRIELTGDDDNGASAWDAFVLANGPFLPRGKLRPGETWSGAEPGFFVFDPSLDDFAPSPVDLRALNEERAGDGGFVHVEAASFVRGPKSEPIRFWGVNASDPILRLPKPAVTYLARHLAKRGVNLVRIVGNLFREDDVTRIDERRLDGVHFLVAELAKNGIYSLLSPYVPFSFQPREKDGFPGYDGSQAAFSLVYFDERLAETYRGWWRQVLLAQNPYTNKRLVDDPALFAVELVNEDSMLFWTFKAYETVPAVSMAPLERRFAKWLADRHGSLAKAFERFEGEASRGDDPDAGRAGLIDWSTVLERPTRRGAETAEFAARVMRRFYETTRDFLKTELGFRGVTSCSNWVTADARTLGPLDDWANLACDFMDRHGYYGGPHLGERAAYSVNPGDRYDDASALTFDPDSEDASERKFELPIMDVRQRGKPSTITELNWPMPNRFRAELPLLAASYGALQDTNAIVFYAATEPGFSQFFGKFSVQDPALLGQFPAASLAYRKGYVTRARPVAQASLALDALFALKGAPLRVPQNLDELRKANVPPGRAFTPDDDTPIDPLAALVGPIELDLAARASSSSFVNLAKFVDRERSLVTSATGELSYDFGRGIVSVNAERCQGVAGFLADAAPIELGAIRFETRLAYGALLLVSLDGLPLSSSERMLLSVMSEARNAGFRASGSGLRRIDDVGRPPLVVRNLGGMLSFRRPDRSRLTARALDPNGRVLRQSKSLAGGLPLLPDVLYYLIVR